jgi:hypothetical protein
MAKFSSYLAHTKKWYETATKKERKNIRDIMNLPNGRHILKYGILEEA